MTLDHHAKQDVMGANYIRSIYGEKSPWPLSALSAATSQPFQHELGRNAALACLRNGTELAIIGSNANTNPIQVRLVRASPPAERPVANAPFSWSNSGEDGPEAGQVITNGHSSRCYEKRSNMQWLGCDFDGKLSVVSHHDSLLLYARANLREDGARHVQVARSMDQGQSWSPFQVLEIDGINGTRRSTNIYYFQVTSLPISHRRWTRDRKVNGRPASSTLVALMPATFCHDERDEEHESCKFAGGVFASFSDDGVRWSRPESLLEASSALLVRTPDQPIGAIQADGEGPLSVLVLRNVDITEKPEARQDVEFSTKAAAFNAGMVRCPNVCNKTALSPFVCRYDFPPMTFAK